ncbi:MAG: cob(I)yrinic acid a,c-diamide adenosyltransferase [Candidatus Hydrogenedentes bacterium]|nr:cob(I)yrinic acid a,c-diamide adenosyltransferase [Candidatus Hydrogenedentota bacterium]
MRNSLRPSNTERPWKRNGYRWPRKWTARCSSDTSAFGTALRACGNGYKVHLIQFMKNGADSLEEQIPGEIKALEKFDNFSYKRFGSDG